MSGMCGGRGEVGRARATLTSVPTEGTHVCLGTEHRAFGLA